MKDEGPTDWLEGWELRRDRRSCSVIVGRLSCGFLACLMACSFWYVAVRSTEWMKPRTFWGMVAAFAFSELLCILGIFCTLATLYYWVGPWSWIKKPLRQYIRLVCVIGFCIGVGFGVVIFIAGVMQF